MMIKGKLPGSAMAALSVLMSAGCGNVTPGGVVFGEATVVVSGDADTLSLAAQLSTFPVAITRPGTAGPALSSNEDEAEGEVRAEFLVFLVRESGGLLPLGDGEEIRVRVDLRGRNEVDAIDREVVPAARYTGFRLGFTEIRAEVEGLVIDGVPVPEVHVELEDLSLLVTRPIDLNVAPGASVELVVDLNTLAWLGAVDPHTGALDETVFQDLINVEVR